MKSNYSDKMHRTQPRFAKASIAIQLAIKERYKEHQAMAAKLSVKPMEWREWLAKEGY